MKKYYLQVYIDNCAYKTVNTQMVDYLCDNPFLSLISFSILWIGLINVIKFNRGFKCQKSVSNGCHDLTMLFLNLSGIAVISVKGVSYRCIICDISKSEVIHLLKNYVLDDRGYM